MADPIPEAPQRAPMDGTHRPGSHAALVAASRWVGQSVAVPRDEQGRVVRHAHLYDADSHYNPTHHVEQMEGEGDLSLLLHHKLATNARSEAALVEYYGEDHRKASAGGSRTLPWEERTRKEAEWKAGIRKDAVPASPAAGMGPAASPARRSSRSFVSDANGVMLLGEDAESFARRAGAWSTRTPTRAGTDASIQNRGRGAGGSARSQLSPGVAGSTAGSGFSGGLRRNASRTPRPSPSTRAVPRVADSKPDEDLSVAEEETAFMLGQAYKLGLGGMLENRQQTEDAEALAVALATKGYGKHHEDRGLRLHQAPPVRHHVRQPQPRQMDWTLTEGHGGARAVHDKDNRDLLPRRHKPHLLKPPSHARSLAAQPETINRTACEMSALVIAGDSAADVGGSPLSSPRGRSVSGRGRGRSSPDGAMKELEQLRRKLQGLSYSHQGQEPKKLFATFDRNNSGELDEEEFRLAVRKGGRLTAAMLDDQALSKLFRAIDVDGSGTIEIDELTSWVWDNETALRLADQKRAEADEDALAFIRRDSTAHGNDNAVKTRQTAATPAKARKAAAGAGRPVSTGAHNLLSDEEYDTYNDKASELDYTLRPTRAARSDVLSGSSPGMSARERGRQANERHRAELEARKLKRHAALAQKQARVAREHSEQLARASALAIRETRGRLEREASIAAEDEMRLYRARLAVTRWRQRLVRSWLMQWQNNALWQKKLLQAWAKLQAQITARHMRDGFHAWAHFTSVKKRSTVLLLHALRRWRNDRLRETFFSWLSYITYNRRVAQALDRTAGRRRQTTMRLTFFGWCETMADERRSRWLASRVESNSCKRLLSLTLGYWRIEARSLARAAAKHKQEADALERARAREADRLAVLNNVAELVSKRRNTNLSQNKTLSLADAESSDGPSVEAVAEAVVEDLVDQEREAALQQLAMEQAEEKNRKKRKKRTKDGGFACCSRPSRH